MKIRDIRHGAISTIVLSCATGSDFGAQVTSAVEAVLIYSQATGDQLLAVGETTFAVKGFDTQNLSRLTTLLERNLHRLCWVADVSPKSGNSQRVIVQVHEFASLYHWPGEVDLGVDEKVVEERRRKTATLQSVDSVTTWLAEKLLIESNGLLPRALISASPNSSPDQTKAFRMYGRGIAADLMRGDDDRLRVTRVVEVGSPRNNDEQRPLIIVEGAFKFMDATIAGEFRGTARSLLDELVATSSGYLHLWKEYNELERKSVLARARELGWLNYVSRTRIANGGWRFRLRPEEADKLAASLQVLRSTERSELEVAYVLPSELLNSSGTAENRQSGRPFHGRFQTASISGHSIDILTPDDLQGEEPPEAGVIFASLSGDRTRLRRREDAQLKIATATCPMPQLGLLIEGREVPERRTRREKPLSPAVRAALGGRPTPRQLEALDVALNTPDIALIQGPPGTGKTRTVAALQIRLAELSSHQDGISGKLLLTSYQHDAVENVASRTVVFGLPAIKVGRRKDEAAEKDGFDRWVRDRINMVRAQLADSSRYPINVSLRKARDLATAYLNLPCAASEARKLVRSLDDVTTGHLSPDVHDRVRALYYRFGSPDASDPQSVDSPDRQILEKAVRRLRTDAVSFSDDGPLSAMKLLLRLGDQDDLLEAGDRELLQDAANWDRVELPSFLGELTRLQEHLLYRLLPDIKPGKSPQIDSELEELLNSVVEDLYSRARESAAGVESVLYDYLEDLENDPAAVRDAVREYTAVLASTCQHSVGHEMGLLKDDSIVFDTVVVDEAARANPLDLLIPLARAERRIILVGDHRQLPHILEPDIEHELSSSVSESTKEALSKSLFQRLFQQLRDRERVDGIKRTVTLDIQFRMHPTLASFVSDTFYLPYGEQFSSTRDAVEFAHSFERYRNAVAAWVNIPLARGRDSGGKSKRRACEAKWIAQEARKILEERPDMSVGIITFYAAQVDEIMREMTTVGLTEHRDDGKFSIGAAWLETTGSDGMLKERLRVGTVDAFQGKEFDVVILSVTRSNSLQAKDELSFRRKFGHLMLENRLCVAMSRQQRLLVAVGDEGMLLNDGASTAVPALVAFHNLCRGPNGICISA